jgi:hypothetical protein
MEKNMKFFSTITFTFLLAFTANVQASLISVNASADMKDGFSLATTLISIGTTVTSDITFNLGAGTINTSNIDSVSGSFNWIDGVFGAQSFNADSASISTINSAGWFLLDFTGSGPTIDGITASIFSIQFNIGTNPFVSPGSTSELFDLVANSSIDSFRVGATQGGLTHSGNLSSNVSGTISTVPEPGVYLLFFTGLLGLYVQRTTRKAR